MKQFSLLKVKDYFMKKLINNPKDIVNELIDGYIAAHSAIVKRVKGYAITAQKDVPVKDRVVIVTGGGSGHEPLFEEYVGKGMTDAAAHGQIFASPSSSIILEAIKAVDGGKGVLLVYCNYAGDVLNFDMAQEMAIDEGHKVDQVRINDDISSGPKDRREDRRGIIPPRLESFVPHKKWQEYQSRF
jgi:dihydroxyacetone kinase-like protein